MKSDFLKPLFLLAASIIPGAGSLASELPSIEPERVGVSSERLGAINELARKYVDNGQFAGIVTMVSRRGKVIHLNAEGRYGLDNNTPVAADTLFRIFSMAKPVTAVAALMLYEEGKFFLSDPVARYIPELAELQVAVSTADGGTRAASDGTQSRTIGTGDQTKLGMTRAPQRQPTIRDLLRHTAGMTYGVFGNTEVDQKYRELELLVDHPNLQDFVSKLG